jgi:hypothetical protein
MLSDSRRNLPEIASWAREWRERSDHLAELVERVNRGGVEPAMELLQEIRECRRRLAEPPAPELRSHWRRALDETWEAACSTLYGDLEPARRHADAALGSLHEMRGMLEGWAD